MKLFKNIGDFGRNMLIVGGCLGMALGIGFLTSVQTPKAQAQIAANNPYYQPTFLINSANATYGTNAHFGITTNGSYPIGLLGTDIVTNFAAGPLDLSGARVVCFQLTASASTNVGALTGQSVIVTLYRSLSGGAATNSFGSNILFDTFGTITLPITSSTTGPWTVVTNFTSFAAPIVGPFKLYAGKLDTTSMTNNSYLTNYSLRVSVN